MMNNLFSMFDPSTSYMSLAWMSVIPLSIIMKNKKTVKNSKMMMLSKMISAFILKEFNQLIQFKKKMNPILMEKVFLMTLMLNFLAIYPFIFTETAHMSMSFSISLTIWVSIMIFNWKTNFKSMMSHLTPMGTPENLMNFMVIIETISSLIRPITLAIRLSANMVAGHLLLSLLSSFSMAHKMNFMLSCVPLLALISLEMMVALVQAYVLTTLMILYQSESN